jgi:hypothetical protein
MITQCIVGPAYTRVLFESKSEYIIFTIHCVQIRIKPFLIIGDSG